MHFGYLIEKCCPGIMGKYDKPLYSISLVLEGEVGGQVKREFTVSVD